MNLISNGKILSKTLTKLMNQHECVQFAIAWATSGNKVYQEILKNKSRITRSVIGIESYITEPQVLTDYVNDSRVKFVLNKTGIFHPKVYVFRTGDDWDLLIGSANMTNGGFRSNTELMLHLSSDDSSEHVFEDTCQEIDSYWKRGKIISKKEIEKYSRLYNLNTSKITEILKPALAKSKPYIETDIIPMSWSEFFNKVKKDPHHGFEKRCQLLSEVRKLFYETDEYCEMGLEERKMVAGLPTKRHPHSEWFGGMKGSGYFHQAVNNNNQYLSSALNCIPKAGKISKSLYLEYISEYKKAFLNGRHGLATATRLLAMKRPDFFVCLDGANKKQLCKDFGISEYTLTYEKYWDEIVVRIMDSVWWNEEKPKQKRQQMVWGARAAMLDAIYYAPTN
ncbi:MAG: phospholipase D family protein [Robiginitomaculum sp.]|nr:phospholipase D family protein [Robiginitomaculum sp.]